MWQGVLLLSRYPKGTTDKKAHEVAFGATIMNTMAVYGAIDHLGPNHVDVCAFADLFYRVALQIQLPGVQRRTRRWRNPGKRIRSHDLVSKRLPKAHGRDRRLYSDAEEHGRPRGGDGAPRGHPGYQRARCRCGPFFRLFADALPGIIRFAEHKNASGSAPGRKGRSLAAMPVAGHA